MMTQHLLQLLVIFCLPLLIVPVEVEVITTSLRSLHSYTSNVGRGLSTLKTVRVSATSRSFFEFDLTQFSSKTSSPTILTCELVLSSDIFDGQVSTTSNIRFRTSLASVDSPHQPSPKTKNTTISLLLLPGTRSWTNEITGTIAPRLRPSSLDPTEESNPSMAQWSHIILPRGRGEDGKDYLRVGLEWLDTSLSCGATFMNIITRLHPDQSRWPLLRIVSTNEYFLDVQPTTIPQNTATDLTVRGNFEPTTWYSCCFASVLNSTSTTELDGIIFRGPFTQARSTSELHCESPPVNETAKHCTTYETVGTWSRCYETLRLVVIRRWRKEGEMIDREIIVGFKGDPRFSDVVITMPPPLLREPNNHGVYENFAPYFEGTSQSANDATFHGAPVESSENPPNLGSVL